MINETDDVWLQQPPSAHSLALWIYKTHVGKPFHDVYLVVYFTIDCVVPHKMPLLDLLRRIIFTVSLGRQFKNAGESASPNLSYYIEPVSATPFHTVIEFLVGKVPFQVVVVVGRHQVFDGVVKWVEGDVLQPSVLVQMEWNSSAYNRGVHLRPAIYCSPREDLGPARLLITPGKVFSQVVSE